MCKRVTEINSLYSNSIFLFKKLFDIITLKMYMANIGAFGLTGLSSLSWIVNYFKQGRTMTEQLDYTKRRIQERAAEAAAQVGQKTKEAGQAIQSKAQEGKESARTDVRTDVRT